MTLSIHELSRIAHELAAVLPGAHVQKISIPSPMSASVELRQPGRSIGLRLEVGAGIGHVGVADERTASPARSLAVQGLWRAHLKGARVDRVSSQGRVLQIDFSTDRGGRTVIVEVEKRGGGLVLLDAAQHVLGVSPPAYGTVRHLVTGQPYTPPTLTPERSTRDRLANPSGSDPLAAARAAAQLYERESVELGLSAVRQQLQAALRGARKRVARTLAKVQEDRARIAESSRYQRYGDLLKSQLARLRRGATEATVTDWDAAGAHEIAVPLLPQLGPRENMERYYHLYRRLSRAASRVDERLAMLTARLGILDSLAAEAANTTDLSRLEVLRQEVEAQGLIAQRQAPAERNTSQAAKPPYREFFSASGARIWVGRNARHNDTLTFRFARGNDLWMHARGQTGSHVVVPGFPADGSDNETLLDAAELASHFSSARDEPVAEVSATAAKYVRRAGKVPGAVTFSQERTIQLRRQPERLKRLLATERKA